jgi:hypothetical protein
MLNLGQTPRNLVSISLGVYARITGKPEVELRSIGRSDKFREIRIEELKFAGGSTEV